jgi:molybdate transport system substrate-binding protein
MIKRMRSLLIGMLCLSSFGSDADALRLAVAANFSDVAESLALQFRDSHKFEVQVVAGSSGKLYAQIRHGAPFDLFLSADQHKPQQLVQNKLASSDTLITYAHGRLLLLSSSPAIVVSGPEVLTSEKMQRLAIANPDVAPYGVAALSFLDAVAMRSETRKKWVMGENISQTFQFVYTENAQLGLVARSQLNAIREKAGFSYWLVPAHLHLPIKQDMVILQRARNNRQARAFWQFVQSEKAKAIIASFGYDVP